MTRMMSTGIDPADRADDVLAIGREQVVLRAGGSGRAHLRCLLPEARRPEGELPLPLQVGRLLVERPDHEHVAIEALEVGIRQRVDDAEIRLGGRGRCQGAVRGENADEFRRVTGDDVGRRGALRRVLRQVTRPTLARARNGLLGGPSQRMPRSDRTFSTESSSPTLMRRPSPAKGRTISPAASNAAARSSVSRPAGSQTKLP